jgi:hypothetical protein
MTCNVLLCGRSVSRLALLSVIVSGFGWGQTITSTIVGQVNDPSGGWLGSRRYYHLRERRTLFDVFQRAFEHRGLVGRAAGRRFRRRAV